MIRIRQCALFLPILFAMMTQPLFAQNRDDTSCWDNSCCEFPFDNGCGCSPEAPGHWDRESLLGDWLRIKPVLAEHGVAINSSLTQYYQGVASGGPEQRFRYGSKFDLQLTASTEKLGLWKGGALAVHAAD